MLKEVQTLVPVIPGPTHAAVLCPKLGWRAEGAERPAEQLEGGVEAQEGSSLHPLPPHPLQRKTQGSSGSRSRQTAPLRPERKTKPSSVGKATGARSERHGNGYARSLVFGNLHCPELEMEK